MAVHIGNIIYLLGKEKGLKAKAIADFVNVSESSLYKIYKRESIDIDKLIKFSKLFNNNLFMHYLNEEPLKSMFSKDVVAFQKQIDELQNELNARNNKMEDLMDIISNQKKVIALHEERTIKKR